MKKIIPAIALAALVASCTSNDSVQTDNTRVQDAPNAAVLLKVDLNTNTFEGGQNVELPGDAVLNLVPQYVSPGDIGSITLKTLQSNTTVFSGGIHWAGKGEISFPQTFLTATDFAVSNTEAPLPGVSDVDFITYGEMPEFVNATDYATIWDAIDNLEVVKQSRQNHPGEKVHIMLYTPSVGVGNPAEWDWIVVLRK